MQTFRTLREENCYYVDKTAYIERLVNSGTHYFLSRPRRFGKSLFLDTLQEFFQGNEALFEGLCIHDRWDWSKRHPVVRLSFGGGGFGERGRLDEDVILQLEYLEEEAGMEESSSHRRLDMAVRTGGHVYLFEFKVAEMAPPGSALAQLGERDYAAKYRARDEPIHLIGVELSRETRNVTAFEVADG